MPTRAPTVLALPNDELPEITDAGVGVTLLMVAILMADRDRQALMIRIADAVAGREWTDVAALHRRLAAVPGPVARMADVARAGIARYDAGLAVADEGPEAAARGRRALVRAANWLDRRFWPMYGAVRPVMPPAVHMPVDSAEPGAGAALVAPSPSCREIMSARLERLDQQLARLAAEDRPSSLTARRITTADRNAQSRLCRECALCPVSQTQITETIPLL